MNKSNLLTKGDKKVITDVGAVDDTLFTFLHFDEDWREVLGERMFPY